MCVCLHFFLSHFVALTNQPSGSASEKLIREKEEWDDKGEASNAAPQKEATSDSQAV